MDKNKGLAAGLLLLAALITALGLFLFSGSKKELACANSIKLRIDAVVEERARITGNIDILNGQRERLVQDVQDYGEKIKALENEIPSVTQERDKALAMLSDVENELAELNRALEETISQEAALRDELENAGLTHRDLQDALEFAGSEKLELEESLKVCIQQSQGVQLPKIIVKVARPLNGEVVEVSEKYNFCVIDLGSGQGVNSGDTLEIYRDNRFIAKALVENVYDDMSSIIVLDQWRGVSIYTGDAVKLHKV
ncbi:MAG: hypothetical protein PHV77_01615 [Candidatus Omnitrophica bacterium]|jgi:predicted RNase H-like nuclease (RuvC/YqgF family)|nr:hypothetical protein [Candidatus Omnitrophota bacterium]